VANLRCVILDDYQDVAKAMADWGQLPIDVRSVNRHLPTEDDVVAEIADCEIVVIMRERTPFPASLLARLPRLRLLVTSGMRNASIDLDAATRHGIVVCGTASHIEPPVELTWALILGLARHVVHENAAMRADGPWQSTIGTDLYGRQLGILGLGKIGAKVARVGRAFGMDVCAWSQNLTAERAAEADVRLASSKEDLLETSDVVSIHLVLSARTRGLIGESELRRMRPDALLINTSRAAIVDQDALVLALVRRWIAGAGADVFDVEPLPVHHPLRTLPTMLALPHLGYVTQRNYERFYGEAVEDIAAFLAGDPIRQLG
jgi:phosphoglycerate dehydrogenase-like enzyme